MEYSSVKNKNVAAIAASIIIAVGTFLPFATASFWGMSQSVTLISTVLGWIVLLCAVIGLFAGYINSGKLMLISGGSSLALALISYTYMVNSDSGDEFSNMISSSIMQRDAGFYFIIIGAILLILANFLKDKDMTEVFSKITGTGSLNQ